MVKLPLSRTIRQLIKNKEMEKFINSISKGWLFSDERKSMLIHEWEDWEKNYLPIDVKGKIVLDVGAGEGETALFYLYHGAKKVICIEANIKCLENLLHNSEFFNIVPSIAKFDIDMLYYNFDFMKMDIEGYEEILLNVDLKKPSIIEVHGLQLRDKFINKGYNISDRIGNSILPYSTTYAFWDC